MPRGGARPPRSPRHRPPRARPRGRRGQSRRLRLRRGGGVGVGSPAGLGIARVDDRLLAAGAAAVTALDAITGEPRWRRPGAVYAGCAGAELVLADATH